MSDKHKDAQGELPELPERDGDWAGDDWYTADSMRDYASAALARRASQVSAAAPADLSKLKRYPDSAGPGRGEMFRVVDVEALFRASEGQAQTSAAVTDQQIVDCYTKAGIWIGISKEAERYVQAGRYILAAQLADCLYHLADDVDAVFPNDADVVIVRRDYYAKLHAAYSTAPGAPVDQTASVGEVELRRWGKEEWEVHWCGEISKLMGGLYYRDYKVGYKVKLYAAPTAQQSLTAGGAVPTDIDGNEFEALMFAYREAKFVYGEYRDVVAFVNEKLIDAAKIIRRYQRAAAPLPQVQPSEALFDFHAHLARQAAWSGQTFGPDARTLGICDHIRKELLEIEADPLDLKEWIDVVILALDGAWRCGGTPSQIIDGIVAKQTKNEGRAWPDWRTMDPNKAIEHDRSKDQQPATPSGALGD